VACTDAVACDPLKKLSSLKLKDRAIAIAKRSTVRKRTKAAH